MRFSSLIISALPLVLCGCLELGDSPTTDDKLDPNDPGNGSTSLLCDKAVTWLVDTCGVSQESLYYDSECDSYDACEAACILNAGCGAWQDPVDPDSAALLKTCRLVCYSEAGATCRVAEQHVRMCALNMESSWNNDRYCDAAERCVANCVLGTRCLGLWGFGDEAAFFDTCQQQCLEPELLTGPIARSAAYCTAFPEDTVCKNGPPVSAAFHCWQYPQADDCADPVAYCSAHGSDPWCSSPQYACLVNPAGTGCETQLPYCADHLDDPLCSPLDPPSDAYCTDYPASPACLRSGNTCILEPQTTGCGWTWPQYCAEYAADPFCFDAEFFSNYCSRYVDSPECNTSVNFCTIYPESPDCNSGSVSYCDQYPEDPYCSTPDYSNRYCEWYPDSPECSSVYEPYCVKYPYDPDCQ
jgi:hypothetical protein